MDDKTSLHNDDPFNPAAEAAKLPDAVVEAPRETPPDEVLAALEMLAAFPEDHDDAAEALYGTVEPPSPEPSLEAKTEDMAVETPHGAASGAMAPEPAALSAPHQAGEQVETAPEPLHPTEYGLPDVAQAPSAVPTHAEHRDGPQFSLPDDEEADGTFDTIEDGIASIFARLHAETQQGADDERDDELTDADDAITFHLLGELDRLWHRAER